MWERPPRAGRGLGTPVVVTLPKPGSGLPGRGGDRLGADWDPLLKAHTLILADITSGGEAEMRLLKDALAHHPDAQERQNPSGTAPPTPIPEMASEGFHPKDMVNISDSVDCSPNSEGTSKLACVLRGQRQGRTD